MHSEWGVFQMLTQEIAKLIRAHPRVAVQQMLVRI
jgi:hypothetical protein